MVIYSHSKISAFEQCKLKFKFQYIDRLAPEVEHTIESFLGKCVHEVLEWIYNNPDKHLLKIDDILKYYMDVWDNGYKSEFKIVKEGYDVEHYYNLGIKFIIDYFVSNKPFDDNTLSTEEKILVKLDNEGQYYLQGYIDRLVYNPSNGRVEIHDYKTGAIKKQEELNNDRQLALYALGISERFPQAKEINLIWHFLAFNEEMASKRTLEQLQQLKIEVLELIKKIESTRDFSPNPSILCKWCGFRKYCPLFNGHKSFGNKSLVAFG